MKLEQIKDTVEQIRQGKQIKTITEVNKTEESSQENENVMGKESVKLDAETKEVKEEIWRKILQINFTSIEDRERLYKIRTDRKGKKTYRKS